MYRLLIFHYVLQKSKASDWIEYNQLEIDWIEWTYTEQYLFSQRLNWKIKIFYLPLYSSLCIGYYKIHFCLYHNSLYHSQKLWNSFHLSLDSEYLLKQDAFLRFFCMSEIELPKQEIATFYFLWCSFATVWKVHLWYPLWECYWIYQHTSLLTFSVVMNTVHCDSIRLSAEEVNRVKLWIFLATASSHWGHPLMRRFYTQLSAAEV